VSYEKKLEYAKSKYKRLTGEEVSDRLSLREIYELINLIETQKDDPYRYKEVFKSKPKMMTPTKYDY
jgi:hypothetical protein